MNSEQKNLEQLRQEQILRKKKKKERKTYVMIGCIAVAVVILLFLFLSTLGSNTSNKNNPTANYGETLSIRENSYNFDITSLQNPEMASDKNHVKLNVKIQNNQSDSLSISVLSMHLTDSNKKELLTLSHIYYYEDTIATQDVASGSYVQGNLFFSEIDSTTHDYITIDQSMLQSITYLKISVLAKTKSMSGKIALDYKDYYLKLVP